MSKKYIAYVTAIALTTSSAFAEGESNAVTVPQAVSDAVTKLENGATAYADVILPYIAEIGLAFVGIAVVYLLFKVFRRFVGGK